MTMSQARLIIRNVATQMISRCDPYHRHVTSLCLLKALLHSRFQTIFVSRRSVKNGFLCYVDINPRWESPGKDWKVAENLEIVDARGAGGVAWRQ